MYRVPSVRETLDARGVGLLAASTFSGCGGSSLGYRMAGFDVEWANEFVEEARRTYRANFPETHVDARDVREVAGEDVLRNVGVERGDLDLFDGSPPCAAFSASGKGSAGWGEVRSYSDTEQRVDDLFFEYARLVGEIEPRVFVAENVAGLTRGVAVGYFERILAALRKAGPGYSVKAAILDARWLGVPQRRTRTIFVGVRRDLVARGFEPVFPQPTKRLVTVEEALAGLELSPEEREAVSIERFAIGAEWKRLLPGRQSKKYLNLVRARGDEPLPTLTATAGNPGAASVTHHSEPRKYHARELRRLCGFPDDFVLTGSHEQQVERLGRAVPPLMMRSIAATIRDAILLPSKEARA